ncbi:MAG: hybrid sensor histidine kinase/response regulator, partial [Rickettsiales bacterium]|nr:hybrid sensor histidine kinase/response regulator [Rickettsiales bacterium]
MDDLIGEFITETSESLAVLDMELVKFEQNPNDTAILSNIFRLVHTIKGTCGFLGLPRLEHVAHAAENVLGRVRDKELDVTPGRISIVLESLDHIKYLVDHLAENGTEPEGSDEELINRLNATAEGKSDSEVEALGGGEGAEAASGEADSEEDSLSEKERAELEAARNEPSIEDILADMSLMADASAETAEAPAEEIVIETPAVPAAQEQPAPKKALEEEVKREAVKEGLQTGPQDQAASGGAAAANQSIRVNLGVLENLMQMVGELVLTRNQLMQIVRNRDDNELKTPLQHLSHITTELQEGIMKTRMQPIGNAWAKFPRLIRDLSIELHKKIELRMEGAETELDRQLLEMIKDPLTHMVRNSCDHG